MTDWVPVMVPPELAARFLRDVADHVARANSDNEPRLWGDATDSDIGAFVRELNDNQRRLLVSLASAQRPVPAAQHAERLGMTVDDIAGHVGPINKRAKKAGWISPVRSHRAFNRNTSEKVLFLDERVALWIKDHYEEDR